MLTTSEIEFQLRGVRFFRGVFACDRLPSVNHLPCTIIVNTDPSNEPGEHWVALHLMEGSRCDYFDPFGFPPLVPELQVFTHRYGHRGQRYNRVTMQDVTTTLCGDYCICFVRCVAKGMDMPHFVSRFSSVASENSDRLLSCVKSLSH